MTFKNSHDGLLGSFLWCHFLFYKAQLEKQGDTKVVGSIPRTSTQK